MVDILVPPGDAVPPLVAVLLEDADAEEDDEPDDVLEMPACAEAAPGTAIPA